MKGSLRKTKNQPVAQHQIHHQVKMEMIMKLKFRWPKSTDREELKSEFQSDKKEEALGKRMERPPPKTSRICHKILLQGYTQ